ncbi:MAG: hypothetical protein WCY25_01065 [Moheibacter sp.]
MTTIEIVIVIFSVIATLAVIWVTTWFVRRKNPPKVSQTEEKKARFDRPEPDEIEDPLN